MILYSLLVFILKHLVICPYVVVAKKLDDFTKKLAFPTRTFGFTAEAKLQDLFRQVQSIQSLSQRLRVQQ